jgi:hypothetical protein
MAFESHFKTWWLHWFACPHCTFHSFSAYARAEILEHPTRLLIRFRCKRCGQDSKLRHPYLNAAIGFAIAIIAFLVIFPQVFAQGEWGLSLVLGTLLGIAMLSALTCALTRVVNKYVPIARVEP